MTEPVFTLNAGSVFATKARAPTVEDVEKHFAKICDFSENSEAIESISEGTMRIMNALSEMPDGEEAAEEENDADIVPSKAKAWVSQPRDFTYTHKDVILYNLGIGAGPQKDPCELRYIYENHEDFMVSKIIV